MSLYLVRHGQNQDNRDGILNGHRDLPLTDLGISQAKNLAQHLKNENTNFDFVLSSPLVRAYETAKIITDTLKIDDPIKENLLIERDFGIMTGKNHIEIEKMCSPNILKTNTITYFLGPDRAETFPDLLLRARKLLDKLEKDYPKDREILLVGHGDFGKMIYACFYGLDWKDVLRNFHFGNSEMIVLDKTLHESDRFYFKQKQHNH